MSASELGLSLDDLLGPALIMHKGAFLAAGFGDIDAILALSEDKTLEMLILIDRELGRNQGGGALFLPLRCSPSWHSLCAGLQWARSRSRTRAC